MKVKTVRKYNSATVKKARRPLSIKWDRVVLIFLLLLAVGYSVFAFLSFRSIKTRDPIREQGSHHYLLSKSNKDFKKTLLIFENNSNGQDRIEHAYIFANNPEKKESVLIYIPSWLYFGGLEEDFGNAIPVSSFNYAGEFLQNGRGVEYSVWQLEQMLGINFDEYIWFTPTALRAVEENLGSIQGDVVYTQYYQNSRELSSSSLFLNSFLSHLKWSKLIISANKFKDSNAVIYSSNASIMSVFVNLKQIESSIYSTKPYLLDLSSGVYLLNQESSSSGGLVNYLVSTEFDSKWRSVTEKLMDRKLEQERVRVEVYNGSGIPGAAAEFARKIENAGCDVVRYDNAPDLVEVTKFYVPNPHYYPQSLSIISELFPGQYEQLQERPLFMTTGDIVIVLGQDISSIYSF